MAGFADINQWQLTGRMARDAEVQESNGRKRLRRSSARAWSCPRACGSATAPGRQGGNG
jgi:hypothetical protein